MATRLGHVEVLYVTEFVGLALIWAGYRRNVRPPALAGEGWTNSALPV
jgi:hypothetical protein